MTHGPTGRRVIPELISREAMATNRWLRALWVANLAVVFAVALWFRVTSLQFAPEPQGDEAFWGVQTSHLIQGQKATMRSTSGTPLNPFFVGMQAVLLSIAEPSFTMLRIPAAISGILAVALTYVLMARALDRPTALLASALLAALPVAIIFSRMGWEPCQVPLWGVLGLYCAFQGRRLALLLVTLAGICVHPSTLLLAPVLLSVLLVRIWRTTVDDPARRWRTLIVTTAVAAAVVLPVILLKQGSEATKWTFAVYHLGNRDWGLFLTLLMKMMLGFCMGAPTEPGAHVAWLFWGVVVVVGVLGLDRLVREGCWERVALVASLVATGAALHWKMGANVLQPGLVRYGLFLVVPAVLAFACLLKTLVVTPGSGWWAGTARTAQAAAFLAAAYALLVVGKQNWFDTFVAQSDGRERLWTLKTESVDPKRRLARLILRDAAEAGSTPRAVVTEDWWTYRPIQFLLVRRKDLRVASLERVEPQHRGRIVAEQLRAGGYVVSTRNKELDRLATASVPGSDLRVWHVHASLGRTFVVYRRLREGEPAPSPCPCAATTASARQDGPARR
jgi:hypothetical protein